jgi:hypothetical protein
LILTSAYAAASTSATCPTSCGPIPHACSRLLAMSWSPDLTLSRTCSNITAQVLPALTHARTRLVGRTDAAPADSSYGLCNAVMDRSIQISIYVHMCMQNCMPRAQARAFVQCGLCAFVIFAHAHSWCVHAHVHAHIEKIRIHIDACIRLHMQTQA